MAGAFGTYKDPDDIDDFTWDWSARLATGETISTWAAAVVTGTVVVDSTSSTDTTGPARISGGADGEAATVRGRIVTSTGRQLDWTMRITVAAQ
jgi:hypothetical protein